MPPKKRPTKEHPVEDTSQPARGQDLTTAEATVLTTHIPQTSHPHTSTECHATTVDVRRLDDLAGQPSAQAEVFTSNTATSNILPLSSHHRQQHNADKSKPKKMNIKIPRLKSKLSSEMRWYVSSKKMSAFGSCRSTCPGKERS
jgi:hypothetical protein